jgi:hypothetical protein
MRLVTCILVLAEYTKRLRVRRKARVYTENNTVRIFIICTFHSILLGWTNKKEMYRICNTYGKIKNVYAQYFAWKPQWKRLTERQDNIKADFRKKKGH